MAVGIFKQPVSINSMPRYLRWYVFMGGLLETALWSGTIFGWASLVHILKTQGVFSNLCSNDFQYGGKPIVVSTLVSNETSDGSNGYYSESSEILTTVALGCTAQDERFALIGTVSMVLYSTPGILVGYALHHLGLAFTRIMASLMISLGFILLSLTSKENPNYLWGSSILLSIGGNTIRMACLEFGNLFPKRRNTAMAIISGIYTLSAALFMIMQSATEWGYRWDTICQFLAAGSLMIIVTTLFMPIHHIPYNDKETESKPEMERQIKDASEPFVIEVKDTQKQDNSSEVPLRRSVLSVSMFLLQLWIFNNMFSITIYGTYFNSWISKFSKTTEEAAFYSRLFGYANLFCVFITPLPGFSIDLLTRFLTRGKKDIAEKVAGVQAMILPMIIVTINITFQISCFFFFSSGAVYLSLIFLIINRPSCLGVGIPFVRARFPPEHFNRLLGIQGTFISLMTTLQYPHFTWTQSQYFLAIGVLVGLLALSIVQPLHLLSKRYLYRVLDTSPSSVKQTEKVNV